MRTNPAPQITHTRLTALCPELPGWAGTRKVKPTWILLKQETVSGSGISWAICKCAPHSRQITTPAPHHSVFLQAGCPSCRPTNSIKALKAPLKVSTPPHLILIFRDQCSSWIQCQRIESYRMLICWFANISFKSQERGRCSTNFSNLFTAFDRV